MPSTARRTLIPGPSGRGSRRIAFPFGPNGADVIALLTGICALDTEACQGIGRYQLRDQRHRRDRDRARMILLEEAQRAHRSMAAREAMNAARALLPDEPCLISAARSFRIAREDFADAALALCVKDTSRRLFHSYRVACLCAPAAWRFGDAWQFDYR